MSQLSSNPNRIFDAKNEIDLEELRLLYRIKQTEMGLMQYRGYNLESYHIVKKEDMSETTELIPFPDASKLFVSKSEIMINGNKITIVPTFQIFLEQRNKFLENGSNLFLKRSDFSSYYKKDDSDIIILYLPSDDGSSVNKKLFNMVRTIIVETRPNIIYPEKEQGNTHKFRNIIAIFKNKISHINKDTTESSESVNIEIFLDKELMFPTFRHAFSPICSNYYPQKNIHSFRDKEGISDFNKLPIITQSDMQVRSLSGEIGGVVESLIVGINSDITFSARSIRSDINLVRKKN